MLNTRILDGAMGSPAYIRIVAMQSANSRTICLYSLRRGIALPLYRHTRDVGAFMALDAFALGFFLVGEHRGARDRVLGPRRVTTVKA